jgi:alanine dehydrogenase
MCRDFISSFKDPTLVNSNVDYTIMSNPLNIENAVKESDLVIGAVLIPGAKAPSLVFHLFNHIFSN